MHLQVEDLLHTKDAFDILYNVVYIKSYCCNKKNCCGMKRTKLEKRRKYYVMKNYVFVSF